MKICLHSLLLLPLLVGCVSSAPKAPTNWTIALESADAGTVANASDSSGGVRISLVNVRAPYGGTRLAVLRPDGSIAFDAFNAFAVTPAALMKGATYDAVEASGLFDRVVPAESSAAVRYTMEVYVTKLALDCRVEGKRTAKVSLTLTLLEGRNVVSSVRAEGASEAEADYSAAFSTAYGRAIHGALAKLKFK